MVRGIFKHCLFTVCALLAADGVAASPAHTFDTAQTRAYVWQAQARDRPNDFTTPLMPRAPQQPEIRAERGGPGPARDAVQRGDILPLETVMAQVQRRVPGRLLDVSLDQSGGRWTYHLKMLTREGRVLNVAVDARDARILGIKGNK